jgi:hypothetical protein
VNEVIGVLEIYFSINSSLTGRVEKIRNKRKRVSIFFRDFVESPIINAEAEGTILLFYKKDGSPMQRVGRADEFCPKIFIQKLSEGLHLGLGK